MPVFLSSVPTLVAVESRPLVLCAFVSDVHTFDQRCIRHHFAFATRFGSTVFFRSHFGSRAISVQVNVVEVSDHVCFTGFLLIS